MTTEQTTVTKTDDRDKVQGQIRAIESNLFEMEVTPKTVYLLVGPPNCGKSSFAHSLNQTLKGIYKTKILSSDEYRKDLLDDYERYKHEDEMMLVSEGAFKKLFHDLELYMSFPQNFDFLFVDTTGMSKEFRDQVIAKVGAAHYNLEMILFNYKDVKDYFALGSSKKLTTKFLTRMRQETLRELNRKAYKEIHKITKISHPFVKGLNPNSFNQRNFDGVYCEEGFADKISSFIIGDVHGCYDELVELLAKKDFTIDPETLWISDTLKDKESGVIRHLIFVGDLIDKGPKTKELIEMAYANDKNPLVKFVRCNHANFVWKYLRGELTDTKPETLKYFDTIELLKADEELLRKFNIYFESTIPYYRNRKVIVTHAPCENQYLEKGTETAHREMRNFRYPKPQENEDMSKALSDALNFLERDGMRNHPWHVFGHISFKEPFKYKNKIGIDTGCYAGGRLTMVEIPHYYSKPFFHSVASHQLGIEDCIYDAPDYRDTEVSLKDLEPSDFRRIKFMAANKVNYVSGTVSPSDKDIETYNLESLHQGIKYYTERGYTALSVQPKYMGSRCNMYLYYNEGVLDLERCYATSRQGYKVRQVDLTELFKVADEKIRASAKVWSPDTKLVLLDGELLPWSALGTGLIDRTFFPVRDAVATEMDLLAETGFEDALKALRVELEGTEFSNEVSTVSKKDLVNKYGNFKFTNFRTAHYFKFSSVAEHKALNQIYSDQLDIFTADCELEFRPWAVLKKETTDGVIHYFDTEVFREINSDKDFRYFHLVDDAGNIDSLNDLNDFWAEITQNKGMEGVVVKPAMGTTDPKHAPFLKVRNPRYLTLVYGYDYLLPTKYEKLIKQKSTSRKMRVSAKEYSIAQRMLEIPNDAITLDNAPWVKLAASMVAEEKNEAGLDPRL